ncbi:RNA polymerase sigma factor, sigma-70 family [Nocardia amikacinitolerans]|uniref:RNA polymerase sigma factor, sigma-70 family n=1 Tax=Nocardia amikacinitolerans TaxID=756689 RepID=A0A285LYN9_9NOCA|nr:sigma-70 family RNA polymerase sigma factor [Nocardia amikacinitolerans]SNY88736.1 RNA polymerase sigma factor, sigma-70 family [Nocardia amikacinitolerans]
MRSADVAAGNDPVDGIATTEDARRAEAELVARAVDGDRDAVAEIIRLLRDPIYRLALRMVWRPAEAEDATQEILIRVITRLATFRGEAKLLTWAYRIGVNYLINLRTRTPQEQQQLSLDEFGAGLVDGLAAEDYRGPQAALLSSEVRLSCSQGMLQCLTREERVAFVLGHVFELSSTDAAWILDITPAAYRKRLERAKKRLGAFLGSSCGIADPRAACRCSRRVEHAVRLGRIDTAAPQFATHPVSPGGRTVLEAEEQMIRLHDVAAVLRGHPDYAAPQAKMDAITGLLTSGRFPLLE